MTTPTHSHKAWTDKRGHVISAKNFGMNSTTKLSYDWPAAIHLADIRCVNQVVSRDIQVKTSYQKYRREAIICSIYKYSVMSAASKILCTEI